MLSFSSTGQKIIAKVGIMASDILIRNLRGYGAALDELNGIVRE